MTSLPAVDAAPLTTMGAAPPSAIQSPVVETPPLPSKGQLAPTADAAASLPVAATDEEDVRRKFRTLQGLLLSSSVAGLDSAPYA